MAYSLVQPSPTPQPAPTPVINTLTASKAKVPANGITTRQNVIAADTGNTLQAPPVEATVDPTDALQAFIESQNKTVGGSAGTYNAGNGAQVAQQLKALRANRTDLHNTYVGNRKQLKDIYGQLRKSLEPQAQATADSYNAAINAAAGGGGDIQDANSAAAAQQSDAANAALGSLGINNSEVANEAGTVAAQGANQLAQQNSSWTGLLGALSNADQQRARNATNASDDAKILAIQALAKDYTSGRSDINDKIGEAKASYIAPSTSGGSAGHVSNPYADQLAKLQFTKLLQDSGLTESAAQKAADLKYATTAATNQANTDTKGTTNPSAASLAKFANAYGTGQNTDGSSKSALAAALSTGDSTIISKYLGKN